MAWWVAEKGSELELVGRTEVSQEAAKVRAVALSQQHAGAVFQVRYHVNANGRTEVHWAAVNGQLVEVTGDERKRP